MGYKLRRLYAAWIGAGLMVSAGWAVAGSATQSVATAIWPAEGNVTCNNYASNKVILNMGTSTPTLTGTVSGPDNTNDSTMVGIEKANYTFSTDFKTLAFMSSTPVDYALVKSATTVSVYIYSTGGVKSDQGMTLPGGLAISSFSLCYGLGNQPPAPPPPPVTKSCNTSGVLDATGIVCPANGQRTLVCNIELDKPFFGMKDGTDTCCVCNESALTACDPNLPYDPSNPNPKACPGPSSGSKEVTTSIEINKDPYYCTTVGGTKTCYPY